MPEKIWAFDTIGDRKSGTWESENDGSTQYTRSDLIPTWNSNMDEAPRDGTEILVHLPDRPEGQRMCIVFWSGVISQWCFFENEAIQLQVADRIDTWMIPQPPEPKEQEDDF